MFGIFRAKNKSFNSKNNALQILNPNGIKNQQNMSFLAHLKFKLVYLKAITVFKDKRNYKQVFCELKNETKKQAPFFCNEIKFLEINRHQFVGVQKCC
jgi:hypothetical protein